MFRRILIANRGEIAVRIIRTCRDMGIETVAIYSTADKSALHVQMATEAVCVGSPKAADSYLNIKNILTAATATGCEAIHPGYGFLSENANFARLVEECGLKYIGPHYAAISRMGDKAEARKLMIASGVPVVPGSDGVVGDVQKALEVCNKIGYPVLIKASAGGGGKGMRKVFNEEDLLREYPQAKNEALLSFGNDDMYIERLILNPRHIEFQILGDSQGHVIHLGERDCSLQRKNQKMMEESPSRNLTPELRKKMGETAVAAAKAVSYESTGTIEFILDKNRNFYFIEMNTRIQVEHPVTEMVTGVDLIREQIRIAYGLPLLLKQKNVKINGHAIEVRINAENPQNNFAPSPGKITLINIPGGFKTRIDTAVYHGYEISPFYDSMIAKIIVHGDSRMEAIRRMRRVLEEFFIKGINTNQSLLYFILYQFDFIKGNIDTGFLERNLENLLSISEDI